MSASASAHLPPTFRLRGEEGSSAAHQLDGLAPTVRPPRAAHGASGRVTRCERMEGRVLLAPNRKLVA